jgi:hypothetical protein
MVPVPGPNKESVSAQALPIKILLSQKINKEGVSAHRKYCCPEKQTRTRGMSHCSLSIYIKKYPNYENSNISPCQNIIFKKILQKKPKSFKVS